MRNSPDRPTRNIRRLLALATTAGVSLTALGAEDRVVDLANIPPSAARSIRHAVRDARILHVKQETENGHDHFEVKFDRNGKECEVTVDASGSVLCVELVIQLGEAPREVREAIRRECAEGKCERIERIQVGEQVTYEALVSTRKERREVKFSATGESLQVERK